MEPLSSVLLFPETEPSIHDIEKLLFFFKSLSYYLPTESDTENNNYKHLLENHCTGYVPAPLHEDLARFNQLLREMENSRHDDLARLFSSAKSQITTGQIRDKDETSVSSVLAALQKDTGNIALVRHKEQLWQARLILKLAEVLDKRENEVRQGLSRISSAEQNIFATIEGVSETDLKGPAQFSDLEKLTQQRNKDEYSENYSLGSSAMLISLRIKAWAELFLEDSSLNQPFAIVTTNPESGSILLDGYENTWRKTAKKLFSLSIPPFTSQNSSESADGQYISRINKFHLAAKENLEYFENILRKTAALQDTSHDKHPELDIQQEYIASWEEKIKLTFPHSAAGYQKLVFYCFPGISSATLFRKIFSLDPLSSKEKGYATSILAILQP